VIRFKDRQIGLIYMAQGINRQREKDAAEHLQWSISGNSQNPPVLSLPPVN